MISSLTIENFRSIEEAHLELGKITILTGANNSGKTSVLYALMALKNTAMNPNQTLDSCLSLPFINLGGFGETVFLKQKERGIAISLGINLSSEILAVYSTIFTYSNLVGLGMGAWNTNLKKSLLDVSISTVLPYALNKNETTTIQHSEHDFFDINWNGVTGIVTHRGDNPNDPSVLQHQNSLTNALTAPIAELHAIDIVPLRRTFTKPFFSAVPLQAAITTEDEIATLLANDRNLEGLVAHYFEKITDKVFQVRPTPGTAIFNLQTRDRATGFVSDLVNEGLGTNQLITVLAKSLRPETRCICIDEPEIHLHPSMITKLTNTMIEMIAHEQKQFLISTHSEHLVISALEAVQRGEIAPEDVKIYYVKKDGKATTFEAQALNAKGQIEGGLKSFYVDELGQLQHFLGIEGNLA
jgi:predicted ATPase